jgi:hypothetical protein
VVAAAGAEDGAVDFFAWEDELEEDEELVVGERPEDCVRVEEAGDAVLWPWCLCFELCESEGAWAEEGGCWAAGDIVAELEGGEDEEGEEECYGECAWTVMWLVYGEFWWIGDAADVRSKELVSMLLFGVWNGD